MIAGTPSSSRQMQRFSPIWSLILLMGILVAGFALRVYALERQSMWTDEGLSLYRAQLPLAEVLANTIIVDGMVTRDTNPPLYFLLLHFWRQATGETVTAMRLLGSLAGWLAVPLAYMLGSLAYGRKVGLLSALLMALSPLHVWQSQVLRNYGLLVTLNLLSVYGLFRFALTGRRAPQWRWLLLWAAAGLLGIYTHYFGLLVFAFGVMALLALAWQRWGSALLRQSRFWLLLALSLLAFAPAAYLAWQRFRAGRQVDFYYLPLDVVFRHALSAFAAGVHPYLEHPWWRLWPALLLVLAGLWLGWQHRRRATLLLAGYQLVPLALLLLLSTVNPLYNGVRHLLIGLPPFLVLVANGILSAGQLLPGRRTVGWARAGQVARIGLGVLAIGIQLAWLNVQFTADALLRDDVRGAAEFLNEMAEPSDLIVLHDTIIAFVFDYYYEGQAPWQSIPLYGEQDPAAAQQELAAAAQNAERLWFLVEPEPRTGFPREALSDWAEATWPRFMDTVFPSMWLNVRLKGYAPQPANADLPEGLPPVSTTFANGLQLQALKMPATARAGEPWWLTWYWSTLEEQEAGVELSLRLRDEEGRLWRQTEDPLWEKYPLPLWPLEDVVRFDQRSTMPVGLPPGNYVAWLSLLDGEAQVVPTADGQREVRLGNVEVTGAAQEAGLLRAHTPQAARLGPVDFLGYTLPEGKIKPGHQILASLFWQVRQQPTGDFVLRLRLLDPQGGTVAESIQPATHPAYPPPSWQRGDVLQGIGAIAMPAGAADAPHRLEITFVDPQSGDVVGGPLVLEQPLPVSPFPLVTELPPLANALDASFGQPPFAAVRGYNLSSERVAPGETVEMALVWQALRDVTEALAVFIHVSPKGGVIVAQDDSLPAGGFRPTTSWRAGEVIVDEHALTIGPEVAPGTYQVWLGFYVPETGERPPAIQDGLAMPDGRILLGEIEVVAGD